MSERMFAVTSQYFSLYQAFREEAEKLGWVYHTELNPFIEEKMQSCSCLFFSNNWQSNEHDPRFSFSNHSGVVFDLSREWNEAICYLRYALEGSQPKKKLYISLRDLSAHHGVDVEDIVITS